VDSSVADVPLSEAGSASGSAWRERAVERSLERARSRAEEKVQRFLDATVELIDERGGLDFTLQDVVDRSEQSLRSFYQFFGGKDQLLLAVAEEAMREVTHNLREVAMAGDDPLDRLRIAVVTLYEWCERKPLGHPPSPHRSIRSMGEFLFDLLGTDAARATGTIAPLFDLMLELVADAREASEIRADHLSRSAALVLQTVMFNAFATPIEGDEAAHRELAEEMWQFCLHGISAS
jgi:AcrR family transcriptional regulator